MLLKPIEVQGIADALKLVMEVFMQYEAPDYSQMGIENFKSFVEAADGNDDLAFIGAYEGDKIIGVIATRSEGKHISLFFVDSNYHRQGVGRALFCEALKAYQGDTMTVNSSPYAVEVYRRLGFVPTDDEQLVDGIRFMPMRYTR